MPHRVGKDWKALMRKRKERESLAQADTPKAKPKTRPKRAAKRTVVTAGGAATRAAERPKDTMPKGMDAGWWALGRKLRFLPVWKGLAAVDLQDPERGKPANLKDLPDRIRTLTRDLIDEGYQFPLVVIPSLGLHADLVRDVTRAGGQVVEVPKAYATLSEVDRIAALAERQPDPRRETARRKVGRGVSGPEGPFDENRFRGPSSRLGAREITAWSKRISDPKAHAADLD